MGGNGRRTLLVTTSYDVTSDVMIDFLGTEDVFRWNIDLWSSYRLCVHRAGFEILDPTGRRIRDSDVGALYWRKTHTAEDDLPPGTPEAWHAAQRRYVVREVCNLLDRPDIARLVEPGAERRVGKIVQLWAAESRFNVPTWYLVQGASPEFEDVRWITKALVMEPLGEDTFLYATEVSPKALDPGHMWFIQQRVEASADVTVVYVDGRTFAYSQNRVRGVDDWRQTMSTSDAWVPFNFTAYQPQVRDLMRDLGLRFGRLDFVLDAEHVVWFLEVNPNGQYAWLDTDGSAGLLEAIAHAARQTSPAHA